MYMPDHNRKHKGSTMRHSLVTIAGPGGAMKDDRNLLDLLKFELSFLEQGGYGRSVHTPWQATSLFQDSLTCLNFGEAEKVHPCDECALFSFVPGDSRNEKVPCHHIPLNDRGDTVASVDRGYNQADMEDALKQWLRKMIAHLEEEHGRTACAQEPDSGSAKHHQPR
jgi:hypothetical protein